MPSKFTKNLNNVLKTSFTQTAIVSANTRTATDTVIDIVSKLELNILNDASVPTSAQLKSISAVLAKLEATGNVSPSVMTLLKTCVNLITKYATITESLTTTLSQLESAQFKASLLEDAAKLKAYLLNRGVSIFPPQKIMVQRIQVAEAVAIHIREFGLPIQMTRLAMIEMNLQNRQLSLDGTILSMIQQFIDTLKY